MAQYRNKYKNVSIYKHIRFYAYIYVYIYIYYIYTYVYKTYKHVRMHNKCKIRSEVQVNFSRSL